MSLKPLIFRKCSEIIWKYEGNVETLLSLNFYALYAVDGDFTAEVYGSCFWKNLKFIFQKLIKLSSNF